MLKGMLERGYEPDVFELDVEPIDLRNLHIVGCTEDLRVLDSRESEPFNIPRDIMDSYNEFKAGFNL